MIGKTINQYKILEKLGGGGMGVVYKAKDLKLDRSVALKFLPQHLDHDDVEKKRFIHEAKAASALDHNNICNIHGIDETKDGQIFIVMAYYAGETVKKKIERGPLPIDEAVDIALQVAQGLGQAHLNGILHRDIKPANILVTDDGIVKIVDFGLAKLVDKTRLTKTGSTVGTVAYMSPEQGTGAEIDSRSDLWSLGVVLYEMLAGQLPFQGDYEQAVIYSIMNTEPQRVTELRPGLPEGMDQIVSQCLEKSPEDRYENAQFLQEDLEKLIEIRLPRAVAHDLKKSISRKLQRLAISIFAAILLVAIWENFAPDGYSMRKWLGVNELPAEKNLAVLPFVTLGGGPNLEVFAKGLVETLTSKLTQLEQFQGALWVLPTADVLEIGIKSAHDAWQRWKIRLVVTGSLQYHGDEIRLTLNLQDAKTLRQLSSHVATGSKDRVFVFQDTVAVALAGMLNIELNPKSRMILAAGRTSESQAYEHYLEGRGNLQDFEKIENLDQAIVHFGKALEHDPGYALAYAGLGEAYWRKFERDKEVQWIDKAKSNCEKAIDLADSISSTHFTLGLIHSGMGNYELAQEAFEATIKLDPASDEAHREVALVYRKQGRLDDAEMYYRKAIQLAPNYWANYNAFGVFFYSRGRFEEAAEQFQKLLALRPDIMRGYINLAGVYFLLDRWDEARKILERALEKEPDQGIFSQLGTVYYYEGRYESAAAMYERARKLAPKDHRYLGFLAAAYYWIRGKEDDARELCRTAAALATQQLEVNPKDPGLLCDLANYYSIMRNKAKAISFLDKAQELGFSDSNLLFQVAEIYEQLGERRTGLQFLSDALDQGISMKIVNSSPFLKNLRLDPGFQDLLDEKGK